MRGRRMRSVASLLAPAVLTVLLAVGHEACATPQPFGGCSNEFWHQVPAAVVAQGPLYALCASRFATVLKPHGHSALLGQAPDRTAN